jgi:signal transduction histidine kinase
MVRSHLEQVLLNLVINAGEAMPDGGAVRIETGPGFFVRANADPRESNVRAVRITVSDDGPGMTDEQRLHAFEPFYSTKEANGHTGLGLAIVYGAVQQAGGRVTLEGEEGRGTRVVILLPCS